MALVSQGVTLFLVFPEETVMIIHRRALMTTPRIRKNDRGTEYAAALTAGRRSVRRTPQTLS
jgi:hypothetical protein